MVRYCISFFSFLPLLVALPQVQSTRAFSSSSSRSSSTIRVLQQHYEPAGWQSGPDFVGESSFAAGVVYNPDDHTVFVTGSTYGVYFDGTVDSFLNDDEQEGNSDEDAAAAAAAASGCFLATYQLPSPSEPLVKLLTKRKFRPGQEATNGNNNVQEACQSIVTADSGKRIFAAGYTESGGLLERLHAAHDHKNNEKAAVHYGMVLDVGNKDETSNDNDLNLFGGYLMEDAAVVYPVSMDMAESGAALFVASMVSDDTSRNEQQVVIRSGRTTGANRDDPATAVRYGKAFALAVERLDMKKDAGAARRDEEQSSNNDNDNSDSIEETLDEDWRRVYAADDSIPVYPSQINQVNERLVVVVGSTAGSAVDENGHEIFGVKDDDDDNDNDDMDGFVLRLHPQHGGLANAPRHPNEHASLRIASVDGKDDWVASICEHPRLDNEEHDVYIVGTTAGRMRDDQEPPLSPGETQAFVMKVGIEELRIEWTVQINADDVAEAGGGDGVTGGSVRGYKCQVTPAGDAVYVTGTSQRTGRDDRDVWLAQLDAATGETRYAKTVVDSLVGATNEHGDDVVAGLTADRDGNAVVVANTVGSLYRERVGAEDDNASADVVVFTVSKDQGRVAPVVDEQGEATNNNNNNDDDEGEGEGKNEQHQSPPMAPPDDELEVLTEQDEKQVDGISTSAAAAGGVEVAADNRRSKLVGVLLGLIAAVLIVAALVNLGCCDAEKKLTETDRSHVLKYLTDFHKDDVEMKHSATGGWHCCYTNDLAEGKNRGNPDANNKTRQSSPSTDGVVFEAPVPGDGSGGTAAARGNPYAPLNPTEGSTCSVVADALFMDDDDDDDDHHTKRGMTSSANDAGYDSLVNAYNSTWQDRATSQPPKDLLDDKDMV